jgi:hypothetical protein
MPLAYKIDWIRRLVIISGEYATATEWLLILGNLRRDPHFKPHSRFLRDVRGATRPPTAAMVAATFNVLQRFWSELKVDRWAIVTDEVHDQVPMTLHSLGQQHGLAIEVFTSMDSALDWLDH